MPHGWTSVCSLCVHHLPNWAFILRLPAPDFEGHGSAVSSAMPMEPGVTGATATFPSVSMSNHSDSVACVGRDSLVVIEINSVGWENCVLHRHSFSMKVAAPCSLFFFSIALCSLSEQVFELSDVGLLHPTMVLKSMVFVMGRKAQARTDLGWT